jgi:hypothetical protein
MKKTILFCLIIILPALFSCKKENKSLLTPCMQRAVDSAMAQPFGALHLQIDAYKYHDTAVYLYTAGCCDRYDLVKNVNCDYLFSPSGGIMGGGDRTHPDFFATAVFLGTVWRDPRQ